MLNNLVPIREEQTNSGALDLGLFFSCHVTPHSLNLNDPYPSIHFYCIIDV